MLIKLFKLIDISIKINPYICFHKVYVYVSNKIVSVILEHFSLKQ